MEKCYEYLGCRMKNCVMYGKHDDSKCWETEGTLCSHHGMKFIEEENQNKCHYCIYYKYAKSVETFHETPQQ